MKKISYKELRKMGISVDDLPDDTEIIFEDKEHRYILEPFRIVSEDNPEYEKALTLNECLSALNNQ